MAEVNITGALNNLMAGKANESEQKILGIIFKSYWDKNTRRLPRVDEYKRAYCPNCDVILNQKMRNGKHTADYCKACGQALKWDEVTE